MVKNTRGSRDDDFGILRELGSTFSLNFRRYNRWTCSEPAVRLMTLTNLSQYVVICSKTWATCSASSLVGTSTRARGLCICSF